jgi:UDP-4-amino-4,6-dideoxy-N-acetyl-beta-L-altrosamine N-acetyltransferase
MRLRDIRNQVSVRNAMFTTHEISIDEHRSWLTSLEKESNKVVLIVLVDGEVSGSLSLVLRVNSRDDHSWAFYLDEKVRGGLGAAIEFFTLDLVFSGLMSNRLICEVLSNNTSVLSLHSKFGFEEVSRQSLAGSLNKQEREVSLLALEKNNWLESRTNLLTKYASILSKFSIEMDPDFFLRSQELTKNKGIGA